MTHLTYLDEHAAAQRLNLSTRTLQRWRKEGGGPPFVRAGSRCVRYSLDAIEAWARARSFPHRAAELASADAGPFG